MAVRCVETFLSCGTCDIVAQTLIEIHGWNDLDLTRSFKFAAIGFCWTGPMMTLWYPRYDCGIDQSFEIFGQLRKSFHTRLDRWFGSQVSFASTARKVAADQILMAPPLTLVIVVLAGLAQGKTRLQELTEKVDEEYVEVMLNRYQFFAVHHGLVTPRPRQPHKIEPECHLEPDEKIAGFILDQKFSGKLKEVDQIVPDSTRMNLNLNFLKNFL